MLGGVGAQIDLNLSCQSGGLGNRFAVLRHPFEVHLNGLSDVALNLFNGLPRGDAAGKIRYVCGEVTWPTLDYDGVSLHGLPSKSCLGQDTFQRSLHVIAVRVACAMLAQ